MVFDFYGTLARAVRRGPTVETVLARYGLVLDDWSAERWRLETIDGITHAEHSTDRDTYVRWEHDRLRRLAESCGASDPAQVAAAVHAAMKDFALGAYDEVPAVLDAIASAGLAVAVCSNWDWDLDAAIAGAGLSHLISVSLTSARVGARKPHPSIYDATLVALGVDPHEVLFVGDTWGPDVAGPLAAGMGAVHVWRDDAPAGDPAGDPPPLVGGARRVADLRGVLELLDLGGR